MQKYDSVDNKFLSGLYRRELADETEKLGSWFRMIWQFPNRK
jgi:hypothetical protein